MRGSGWRVDFVLGEGGFSLCVNPGLENKCKTTHNCHKKNFVASTVSSKHHMLANCGIQ